MYAYVGSRTTRERNARGEGISIFRVDAGSGELQPQGIVGGLVNPSFLAMSGDGRHLYAVHGDQNDISAFRIDPASGGLAFINRQDTLGKNPVHLAIDPAGRHIVVSNHLGSSLVVLPIASDGSLGAVSQRVDLTGPIGPHRVEQNQAKPHFNPFDRAGKHVIVPDKGLDRTFVFHFEHGRLAPAPVPFVASREGAGPRHIAFHPGADFAYEINELDSTVTTYRYSPADGGLEPLQILSSLPESFTGTSRSSEIEVHPSGRFVYASNRGCDSIAVFAVDPETHLLSWVEAHPSGGRTPRFFALSRDGRFLYALNEDSDTIVAHHVDPVRGTLAPTGFSIHSASPVCMVFSTPRPIGG